MISRVLDQAKVDHFSRWFSKANRIVIVTHTAPDGDAIGSSLGLYHFFTSQGKEACVVTPNTCPDFLKWMPGIDTVLEYDKDKALAEQKIADAEIVCCLDFNTIHRIDEVGEAVLRAKGKKLLLDHHLNPADFCDITMSYPSISSTSELAFRLICRMGYYDEMSKECAECIYTGMMTDTGAFTYNSNHKDTYIIVKELIGKGIDKDAIYRKVFNTYSESRLRLMGHVLSNMQVFPEYNSSLITLTQEEQDRFNYVKGDSEGFVNMPLSIKNMVFSCYLREDKEKGMIKVSLRSVGTFPCNKLAKEYFNGGGHLNASGGEFYGDMEEAISTFKKAIEEYRDLLTNKE